MTQWLRRTPQVSSIVGKRWCLNLDGLCMVPIMCIVISSWVLDGYCYFLVGCGWLWMVAQMPAAQPI